MKEVYYKKVGRKYVPVSEYDSFLMSSLPEGNHMIMCYPGGSSTRHNINPNHAAMIAAGRVAEDAISRVIMKATELRRSTNGCKKLTPEQKEAWEQLVKVFGEDARQLEWPSAREACQQAVEAMVLEADKLMNVPSVKKAYEHFLLVAELTKDHNNESES